ncbi:MAG TPA: hypothetical protein VKB57_23705 [Acidimicrobiales bacterium]|nr:hypothetical protein [Acidimicrobiales bacterium]
MTAPTITRRNHGRGHSYQVDGEKFTGVTTLLDRGYPKPAIAKWAARTCGEEVTDYWDELAALLPSERGERVRTAPDRDRDAAARRGTEVHRLASKLIAHEEVQVPDELVGHVDAYLRFLEEWGAVALLVEAPIANLRLRYAGTLDLVADLDDGLRWLLDLKTTRSGVFVESALQLAAYRRADFCVGPTGEVVEMPPVDRCGVVWLRADRTYEFVPVDTGDATFDVFKAVIAVASFGKRDDVIEAPRQLTEVLF